MTLHRSDSSGDTFLFTQYLSKADPSGWGAKIGYNTTVPWPNAPGALGENGQLGHGVGLQGHAGLRRLHRHQLPDPGPAGRSRVRRAAATAKGQYVLPTQATIAAEAAGFVKKTPANGTISLIYGPVNNGYPIVNYEYAIVSNDQSSSSHGQEHPLRAGVGHQPEVRAQRPRTCPRSTSSRCPPRSWRSRSSRS